MKAGVAALAGLLLAVVAFRRARRVLVPEARRATAGDLVNLRRVGIGLVALTGIVWATRQLFT